MEVIIKGDPKEITDLIQMVQGRRLISDEVYEEICRRMLETAQTPRIQNFGQRQDAIIKPAAKKRGNDSAFDRFIY